MKPVNHLLYLLLMASTGLSSACDDAGTSEDELPGSVEATGIWDGAQPAGVNFDVAVFECPFSMPPKKASLDNPVDPETGAVSGIVEDIEPGEWCVMAYIDMNPEDGLAPVKGTDAINHTGQENEDGAIPIIVESGRATTLQLEFAL